MKLASFSHQGRSGYGAVAADGIIDLGQRTRYPTVLAVLAADALGDIRRVVAGAGAGADFHLSEVTLSVPLPEATTYFCVGRNYKGHVAEVSGSGAAKLPDFPSMFLRRPSSLVASGQPIVRPSVSGDFDFEGELALVIGKAGRHITPAAALEHVAAYTILMDGSIRDYQFKHCLTVGKNFDRSGSIGPWMVTAGKLDGEISDPSQLELITRLNGQVVQHTRTNDFIFDIPYIVAYISAFTQLMPGDIIATGTPEGVGFARKPPLWMKAGDTLEVEIPQIGTLRNAVVAETV
jgi:2-keto-4-pentenoate hydratase/2-oxohepta-3-ene-1,7-dioic acid hydratase in catechol pathway